MKPVNLDDLEKYRPTIEKQMPDGSVQTFKVMPVSAETATALAAAEGASGTAVLERFAEVVETLVPDMPPAMVRKLSMQQLLAIVECAGEHVEKVKEAAGVPKAVSPAKRRNPGQTK